MKHKTRSSFVYNTVQSLITSFLAEWMVVKVGGMENSRLKLISEKFSLKLRLRFAHEIDQQIKSLIRGLHYIIISIKT